MRFLFGLVAFFATLATGCASVPSEECTVIYGIGNYAYLGPQVVSSSSTPGFLSDPDYLFDGRPSTQVAFQWGDGTQTTSSFTGIEFGITTQGEPSAVPLDVGVVAILNTDLPEALKVQLRLGSTVGTLLATGTCELEDATQPDGPTSCIFALDDNVNTAGNLVVILFMNDALGSHPIAPSSVRHVGEIFVGSKEEFQAKRTPQFSTANTAKVRMSSAGVQWNVLQPQVGTLQMDMMPIPMEDALRLRAVYNTIMNGNVSLFIPFDTLDPAYYGTGLTKSTRSSYQIRAQCSILGQFTQAPTIKMNSDMYFDSSWMAQASI